MVRVWREKIEPGKGWIWQRYLENDREANPRDWPLSEYDVALITRTMCENAGDIYQMPLPSREQERQWRERNGSMPHDPQELFTTEESNELWALQESAVVSEDEFLAACQDAGIHPTDADPKVVESRAALHKNLDDGKLIELAKNRRFQELINKRFQGHGRYEPFQEWGDMIKALNRSEEQKARETAAA